MSLQYQQIPRPQQEVAVCSSTHILLVEDGQELRELMTEFLLSLGYSVSSAASTAEAISLTKHAPHIDLVITDVIMPKENGYDLAAKLRHTAPEMKFLFISGYSTEIVARTGSAAIRNQFLAKPFSMAKLGAAVCEILL